jgi:hypothetical protein
MDACISHATSVAIDQAHADDCLNVPRYLTCRWFYGKMRVVLERRKQKQSRRVERSRMGPSSTRRSAPLLVD